MEYLTIILRAVDLQKTHVNASLSVNTVGATSESRCEIGGKYIFLNV